VTTARRTRGAHLELLNTCQYVRAHAESEAVNCLNIRCHNALPVGVGVSPTAAAVQRAAGGATNAFIARLRHRHGRTSSSAADCPAVPASAPRQPGSVALRP